MPYPLARFRAEARRRLEAALAAVAPGTEPRFVYAEAPPGHGDYAAGCFPLAGALKRAPAQIAALLAETVRTGLAGATDAWVAGVEVSGPYVNFHVALDRLAAETLAETQRAPERFGELPARSERVVLEHTSANPNGPLHVGRARNPVIGDTLVRLYRAAGYPTEVQYYVDDMGKQVAILTWGLENLSEDAARAHAGEPRHDKVDHRLVRYYQAANAMMEADASVQEAIQGLIRATEAGDADALMRVQRGYRDVFDGMLQTLARLDVTFDSFIQESRFVANGDTERVVDRLASQDSIPVGQEGQALYLDLAVAGVTGRSTRFFFRRSDGTSLYATRDVAYHLWKAEQADRLVNVLGEDHKLQATQVRACLEVLGAKVVPEVVFYSFVSLPEGKMSTRRNRVVFIDDLLDEAVARAYEEVKARRGHDLDEAAMREIAEHVGVGSVRFGLVKVQCEKPITFVWEEALSFDGFAAPFVQYAHARVCSILAKAEALGLRGDPARSDRLTHPSEAALVRQIAALPALVEEAAEKHKPHLVPQYAYDVAVALNAFYRDCRVLDADDPDLVQARLALVSAARVALARALHLIGIVAPNQM